MHVCGVRSLFSGVAAPLGCAVLLCMISTTFSSAVVTAPISTSYNIVTAIGTVASRVCFHLKAEAVRM